MAARLLVRQTKQDFSLLGVTENGKMGGRGRADEPMKIPKLRTALGTASCIAALLLAGCQTAQPPAPDPAAIEAAAKAEEARSVAESSLGKQAEVLAQGDLALNGRQQVLVINRLAAGAPESKGDAKSAPIFVRRAAVLEKNDGKWSEILLCDEHLKNPNGYLGGSPRARVSGWRLEYGQDAAKGLEMKFTPMEKFDSGDVNVNQPTGQTVAVFDVRWNNSAKRYQSFDPSHERYLTEIPMLETPESVLK